MTLPLSTTTITIERRPLTVLDDPADPADYSTPEWELIESNVPAVISPPTASNNLVAGDRITYSASLRADPCDLKANDRLTEEDGTVWTVLWARPIVAVGLDHTEAQLRMVTGFSQ